MSSLALSPSEARIVRLMGPRELVFETCALPAAELQQDEILAATDVTAISPGTELAAYTGAPPLRPGRAYPRLQGYCNVSRVIAAGERAGVAKGDRVLTFQSHRSHFRARGTDVLATVPPEMDSARAAVTYLFHLGYAALMSGGFRPGHDVAVIGQGAIGFATTLLAQALGARVIAVSSREMARRRVAARGIHGASPADADERFASGIDLVITTSNNWADWRCALQLARKGGCIAVLSFPGRGLTAPDFNPLDSRWLYDKQLTIVGAGQMPERDAPPEEIRFTVGRNMKFLLALVQEGRLDAAALLSGSFPAEEITRAYETLLDPGRDALTFALRWS
jgi:2-desacetyl-2-hydroxyethyl bacteriochlorophyllide A dehydrogenase